MSCETENNQHYLIFSSANDVSNVSFLQNIILSELLLSVLHPLLRPCCHPQYSSCTLSLFPYPCVEGSVKTDMPTADVWIGWEKCVEGSRIKSDLVT